MAQQGLTSLLKYLQRRGLRSGNGLPDSELLDRYVRLRDEAAFELLVWRHGTLVLNVCRRILRNDHDVDDAFQAAFATLACKARTIRGQRSVAPWLYKVAYRAALSARTRSHRHVTLEREAEPVAVADDDLLWRDVREVLDSEVHRLSAKYRDAFVLCYLQGLTHAEAAVRLSCPEGTVHSRLATAKERLRRGLERRGVTLSGTSLGLDYVARQTAIAPSVHLIQTTLTTACLVSGAGISGAAASSPAIALSKGVLFTMWMQSFTVPTVVAVTLGLASLGFLGIPTRGKEKSSELTTLEANAGPMEQARNGDDEKMKKDQLKEREEQHQADVAVLRHGLTETIDRLVRERADLQKQQAALAHQASMRLLQVELNFQKSEQKNQMVLLLAKKKLEALQDEEISLSRELRKRKIEAKEQRDPRLPDMNQLATQIAEVHKLFDQELARIEQMQQQATDLEVKSRLERADFQTRVKLEEGQFGQSLSHTERSLEQLEQQLQIVELAEKFPKLSSVLGTSGSNWEVKRLEAKLNQVLQELADLKKQQGKP